MAKSFYEQMSLSFTRQTEDSNTNITVDILPDEEGILYLNKVRDHIDEFLRSCGFYLEN